MTFIGQLEKLIYRNYTNPNTLWKKVKRDFIRKTKEFQKHTDATGTLFSMQYANLSKDGYEEIKQICDENGIDIIMEWSTPYYQVYLFKVKIL